VRTDQTGRLLWEHPDTPEVSLPVSRRRASRIDLPQRVGSAAFLNPRPFQIALAVAIALGFGAVAAVIADVWWVLPLAAGINALGTLSAAFAVARIKATASLQWKPVPSGLRDVKPVRPSLRARLLLISQRMRARLEVATQRMRARLQVATQRMRAGLQVATQWMRAGLKVAAQRMRAGLKVAAQRMRAGLQVASQSMRTWLRITNDVVQKLATASLRMLRSMLDRHRPERSRTDSSRAERSRTNGSGPERSRTDEKRPERSQAEGKRPERSQTDRRRANQPKRAVTRH
jgi:hypothetical protein